MSNSLKDEINSKSIKKLSFLLAEQYPGFDVIAFNQSVFSENWQSLTLKQRIRKITNLLHQFMDKKYTEQLKILMTVSVNFSGLFHFIFADFVEKYGQNNFEDSMQALELFTQNSTAEFAVRTFLQSDREKTKRQMLKWSVSDNEHLRCLSSEGVRPRLPWATHLPWVAENPDWVRPILENLKFDTSAYVQKSVANLINDLSKNQTKWVLTLCEAWLTSGNQQSKWIVKHGLRTLLKQGNTEALKLLGYLPATHIALDNWYLDKEITIGERLHGSLELTSSQQLGLLRIEYAISFLRKHQPPYRKVFKIAESNYEVSQKHLKWNHNFKIIRTREYVPGMHIVELMINGKSVKTSQFNLLNQSKAINE
jgi:3-methyladenine DNA glycosylase AlkC